MEKESIVAPVQIVLDAGAAARQLTTSELQCHPGFADLHNRMGLLHAWDGRPDRAVRSFREALGINPGYFWAAANLSMSLVGAGRVEEALEALDTDSILAQHPSFCRCRAASLLEADMPEVALVTLESDTDPGAAFDHHIRALCYLRLNRRQEAMEAFVTSGAASPLLDRLYRQRELLGPGALERVSPRQAAAPIRIFPGMHVLYDFFAQIYARHGFRTRAVQSFEEGQILWPYRARHEMNLGRTASWLGDSEEARERFLSAIEFDPELIEAHISLGHEYACEGEVVRAIEQFEHAARLRPGYADIRYQLGLTYMEVGRLQDAVDAFAAAISINPAFHFARMNLALALRRASRSGEAIAEYEQLLSQGRATADLYMNMGLACIETDDPVRAEDMFRKGIGINPDFALNYYHLGIACQRQGNRDRAKAAWKSFLERQRESELAREVIRQMNE